MRSRLLAVVLAVSAASVASTFLPGPAIATTIVRAGAIADVDGDTIPDGIERVVCGSATCATGTEDTDGDGIPDVVEVAACGSTSCADPGADDDYPGRDLQLRKERHEIHPPRPLIEYRRVDRRFSRDR